MAANDKFDKSLKQIPEGIKARPADPQHTLAEYLQKAAAHVKSGDPKKVETGAVQLHIAAELLAADASRCLVVAKALDVEGKSVQAAEQRNQAKDLSDAAAVMTKIADTAEQQAAATQTPHAPTDVDVLRKSAVEDSYDARARAQRAFGEQPPAAPPPPGAPRPGRPMAPGKAVTDTSGKLDLAEAADIAHVAMAESLAAIANSPLGTTASPMRVQMKRADVPITADTALWFKIRRATTDLGWDKYSAFLDKVLCPAGKGDGTRAAAEQKLKRSRIALPFPDVDAYRLLKAATEVFMMVNCSTWDEIDSRADGGVFPRSITTQEEVADLDYGGRRFGTTCTATQIEGLWSDYLKKVPMQAGSPPTLPVLPYLAIIRGKLQEVPIVDWAQNAGFQQAYTACSGILREKLTQPCLMELIWSYWHEEGMLVQTMNAITRRFQNVRTPGDRDPLATLEMDPLRPLNNFLWGYIQDEQHRLTVVRRAYEYDHHYGLALVGKAVPGLKGADSRTQFLEAFHGLLHLCTMFYQQDDDTTVIADGFPVLNALRDVHIVLSQGAHNQYGDLPWTARHEMLMQEWLLARPEMREFLPTRIMVAYPEPWMDRVDATKSLMGWTDTSVLHFRELGVYGERLLLGIRFNNWTEVIEPEQAANWARFWRPEVQGYIHAYRAVAGVDLTERVDSVMPSTLLRSRLAAQRLPARS